MSNLTAIRYGAASAGAETPDRFGAWYLGQKRKEECGRLLTMPTVLRIGAYRFYFYSYDCGEPRHTHVDRENRSAKFWLDPDVALADNHGYSRKELRDIERMIRENLEVLKNEWDTFCGGDTHTG